MNRPFRSIRGALKVCAAIGALSLLAAAPASAGNEVNPCAAKSLNPCAAKAMNPCAAKTMNPCQAKSLPAVSAGKNPCNPCAMKHEHNPCNPCGMKMNPCNPCGMKHNPCNPCGMKGNPCNPCGGGAMIDPKRFKQPRHAKLHSLKKAKLAALGEKLWNDRSLGKSNLACASCHVNDYTLMEKTFAKPYPHYVKMPHDRAGVSEVNAAEMVNFCMLVPMNDEPLSWKSKELAALAAYVEAIRPGFKATQTASANPCNPCGMKHNPCAMKHKKNPCNPCGRRSY